MSGVDTAHPPLFRTRALDLVQTRPWAFVVGIAMTSWWLVLFAEMRSDYLGFRLARYDLGNMVQAVWSTAHGHPLEMTLGSGDQAARLASHVDPILALLAPLWLVFPSPLTVAAAQLTAVALGALPVFWLARRHLESERAAGLLALTYLAYPWLAWTALDAMHPVTLAIPLLLYAIWFLDTERIGAFVVCAVLIAATGELMGVVVAGLGLWFWLARGHRTAGLLTAAGGVAWTVLCLKVIVPHFNGGESPFYDHYYTSVGGSPEGVLQKAVSDPGAIVAAIASASELQYVVWLGAPLIGLFLLSPAVVALALPQLLANALSDNPPTTDPRHQYIAGVVPFLIAGLVLGLARLSREQRVISASLALAMSVVLTVLAGAWPGAPAVGSLWYAKEVPAARVAALESALELVPDDAPVTATNKAGLRLSARRYFFNVPYHDRARWIVLDTNDPLIAGKGSPVLSPRPDWLRQYRRLVEADASWTKVFDEEGVLVFRRTES